MASGDREWTVEAHRNQHGMPVNRRLPEDFHHHGQQLDLDFTVLEGTE
jgi:hypothetical protein